MASVQRSASFPLVVLRLIALFIVACPSLALGGADRPNIVFILTDDQRFDSLGLTGNPIVKTPNIDKLAADGVFFENAYVGSAICTPSRACYFLGQYERRHGVNFNSGTALTNAAWEQGYPIVLRKAGYFTGYIGKNHVPVGEKGFDTGILEKSFDFWYAGHNHLTFYPKKVHPIFRNAKADTQVEILEEGSMSFLDPKAGFVAGAEAFLKQRPTDQPFCLSVCFNLPHAAGASSMQQLPSDPELYRTAYREHQTDLPLVPEYVAKADIKATKLPADVLYAQYRQPSYKYVDTAASLREQMIREYQTITGIDRMVGELRAKLEALGVADNTVIVYSSDHGITHGEFGLGGKALNYEMCLHVPMIILDPRLPAARKGQRVSQLMQSIDVAPTFLDLAGVKPGPSMQGRSLVPLMSGEAKDWRRYAFAENLWSTAFGNPRVESVRGDRWKYLRYFKNDRSLFGDAGKASETKAPPKEREAYATWLSASVKGEQPVYEELFDLANDPNETKNLATDPAQAGVLKEMRAACQAEVTAARGNPDQAPATVVIAEKPAKKGKGKAAAE